MSSVDVTVRAAEPADTQRIVSLLRVVFGADDLTSSSEYWQWKHIENPFGASPVLLAEAGGDLVGLRAFMRWTWHAGSQQHLAVRAVDTATHPDWRGDGIFSRLTKQLVQDLTARKFAFVFNTPNEKSLPGYLKMGWGLVTRVPVLVTPGRLRVLAGRLARRDQRPPEIAQLDSVDDVLSRPGIGELLAGSVSRDRRLHTRRSAEYLRWRYHEIPGVEYRAVSSVRNGVGAVAIVRSRVRRSLRELTISELIVTPSLPGIARARQMLRRLRRSVDADYLAACAATSTPEARALAASGFVRIPKLGPQLTARPLNDTVPDPLQWSSWRCGLGDLELF